jgi:hypothetical protein
MDCRLGLPPPPPPSPPAHPRLAPLLTCTRQVIDEEGVNRTPKPLTAIVPSIALRQAKLAEDGNMLAGEVSCDGLADRGLLSSSGFSRGWFSEAPSGAMTPSGDGRASEAGGHGYRERSRTLLWQGPTWGRDWREWEWGRKGWW